MPKEQGGYISYLLRLWKSNERGNTTWRASLESTAEGRRYNFAHVESLVTFLLAACRREGSQNLKTATYTA